MFSVCCSLYVVLVVMFVRSLWLSHTPSPVLVQPAVTNPLIGKQRPALPQQLLQLQPFLRMHPGGSKPNRGPVQFEGEGRKGQPRLRPRRGTFSPVDPQLQSQAPTFGALSSAQARLVGL